MRATHVVAKTAQGQKTKTKIYKTAISLFNKRGYRNVTVRDICAKADVAIGVFYHHYQSKGSILLDMVAERDRVLKEYANSLAGMPPKEQLMELLRFYSRETMEIGVDSIKVLFNPENVITQELEGGPRGDSGEIIMLMRKIVDLGTEDGTFSFAEGPGRATQLFAVALRGLLYDWCRNQGNYDLEEVVIDYMNHLVKLIEQ